MKKFSLILQLTIITRKKFNFDSVIGFLKKKNNKFFLSILIYCSLTVSILGTTIFYSTNRDHISSKTILIINLEIQDETQVIINELIATIKSL